MKLGIIGTGRIVDKVAPTLAQINELELYAVASRELDRAKECAAKYDIKKAYGSYEELYADSEVEFVYICTPHPWHYPNIVKALNAGKNVICEKPITINADEAKAAAKLASEKGLYLAEAMWPRYMPSRNVIQDVINSGIVGEPYMVSAHLLYDISFKERISKKEMAGGALLDLGVYCINFCLMILGDGIEKIESNVKLTDTGVDETETIIMYFKNGKMGAATSSIACYGGREGVIRCKNGYIVVDNVNSPTKLDVYGGRGDLLLHKDMPVRVSGYEYEFEEAIRLIKEGKTQSESMPLDESIKVMEICDSIRDAWNK